MQIMTSIINVQFILTMRNVVLQHGLRYNCCASNVLLPTDDRKRTLAVNRTKRARVQYLRDSVVFVSAILSMFHI